MINISIVLQTILLLSMISTWISQSLLDLLIWLMPVLAIIYKRQELKQSLGSSFKNLKQPLILFGIYFFIAVLGYLVNARPGSDAVGNLVKFDWILQFLIVYLTLQLIGSDIQPKVLQKLKYVLLIPALYGFTAFFTARDLINNRDMYTVDYRIIGLINSPTYHAHVGVLLLAIYLILLLDRKIKTKIDIVIPVIMFFSIFFTETRGALIGLSVGFAGYLAFRFRHLINLKKALIAVILIAGFGLTLKKYVWDYRVGSNTCRSDLLQIHVDMVKQYPLLGIGYRDNLRNLSDFWPKGKFSSCQSTIDEGSQAHNQLLNVAATTGFLGLFSFLAIYIYFCTLGYKLSRLTNMSSTDATIVWACIGVTLIFAVSSQFEVMFEFGKIRYILITCWAALQYLNDKYANLKKEK